MTIGQYRALVAYLNYWTPLYPNMNLDVAIVDLGITDSRSDVIHELFKAGHTYDEETGQLVFED